MELPGSGHFAVGNPVDDTVQKNDSQPPPYSTERAIAKMGCCTWHYAILIVGFVLFFIDMWLPFWAKNESPFDPGCVVYAGAFGFYYDGCGALGLDGWTEYPDELVDSDIETIQGGATVAFLFGLGAVIAKGCAWKADPPAKNALIASAILTSIAILGAVISWGKAADLFASETLFLCFALQLIASFMVVASVVMDVKAVGSSTV